MKPEKDKKLEDFVNKLIKETSLESPSSEFTKKLMMQVQATEMEKSTVYKPLISKRWWVIIFIGVAAGLGYLFFNPLQASSTVISIPDLNPLVDKFFKDQKSPKFSTITVYAFGLLSLMVIVQIGFLKNYFNKRMELRSGVQE